MAYIARERLPARVDYRVREQVFSVVIAFRADFADVWPRLLGSRRPPPDFEAILGDLQTVLRAKAAGTGRTVGAVSLAFFTGSGFLAANADTGVSLLGGLRFEDHLSAALSGDLPGAGFLGLVNHLVRYDHLPCGAGESALGAVVGPPVCSGQLQCMVQNPVPEQAAFLEEELAAQRAEDVQSLDLGLWKRGVCLASHTSDVCELRLCSLSSALRSGALRSFIDGGNGSLAPGHRGAADTAAVDHADGLSHGWVAGQ